MTTRFVPIVQKYTLIVTEKPDAAQRIASALDLGRKAKRMKKNGVPYYVAKRDREIVVVPALGHLYTVVGETSRRNFYPVFNFKWAPRYAAEKGAHRIRRWLQVITDLARGAGTFIDACDFDLEGSIIGYSILKYACDNKETVSKRMKYSTLTEEELKKSYDEMLPHLDFALIEAGRTRHEVDWLYGVNLSRALTIAAKEWSGTYATLSTGRVQGPVLKFLVTRERSIRSFVPMPYWEISAELKIDGQLLEAKYIKRIIQTKREAEAIQSACQGRIGHVEKIETKQYRQLPPPPFDLGTLQREAYDLFGYSPKRTSDIAQRLYLDALISYPRTSSQKLPLVIGYKDILKNLSKVAEHKGLAAELLAKPELKPNEGNKEDPAHPAIYPTGKLPQRTLDGYERNIWNLVVRRFMAVFGESAIRQTMKVHVSINDRVFFLKGTQTLKAGWLHFYEPYARTEETLLPRLKEDQMVDVNRMFLEDKFTKPPPWYNPSSLLRKMEKVEIGTKATRADIIQTLYDRKYIRDERMTLTDLGFEVFEVLKNHSPTVVSIKLTRELERRMNQVRESKEKRENVLASVIEILKPIMNEFKEKQKEIGEQLSDAIRRAKLQERIIGTCPTCKTGNLTVLRSRKTGKQFIGCTNYFERSCRTSFPLPQRGTIIIPRKNCRGCGWPTVQVFVYGRRPWTLCFNPRCSLKEKRMRRVEMPNMQPRS
jgi:DNA topoisomerase-1